MNTGPALLRSVMLALLSLLFAPAFAAECTFSRYSDRVYIMVGSDLANCPADNPSFPRTNPAAVIGEAGVILIDPGSSLQVGQHLLKQLEALTDKPVVAVINTHIHGLYWLGNQAIRERFPNVPIYAHHRMIERIDAGEGRYWENMMAFTNSHKSQRTRHVVPNKALLGNETMVLAGVHVRFHHPGHGHTDHDLLITFPEDDILFLGGLVVEPEVPSQGVPQDANFAGQIKATQWAVNQNMALYVPGQGYPQGPDLPRRGLAFLQALYTGVERDYEQGMEDYESSATLKRELAGYRSHYDFKHLGGVVSEMYLQIEDAQF